MLTMHVMDMPRPFISVSRICDAGHQVPSKSKEGYAQREEAGQTTTPSTATTTTLSDGGGGIGTRGGSHLAGEFRASRSLFLQPIGGAASGTASRRRKRSRTGTRPRTQLRIQPMLGYNLNIKLGHNLGHNPF